jgi:serine/threonine protein phosphatase PrpC
LAHHQGRLAISRSLGDNRDRQYLSSTPDITAIHLDEPDNFDAQFVVVATDGLWDVMTNEEVVRTVRSVQLRQLNTLSNATTHSAHREEQGHHGGWHEGGRGLHDLADEGDWVTAAVAELTNEAYVRSSMDNIGVLIIPLNVSGPT